MSGNRIVITWNPFFLSKGAKAGSIASNPGCRTSANVQLVSYQESWEGLVTKSVTWDGSASGTLATWTELDLRLRVGEWSYDQLSGVGGAVKTWFQSFSSIWPGLLKTWSALSITYRRVFHHDLLITKLDYKNHTDGVHGSKYMLRGYQKYDHLNERWILSNNEPHHGIWYTSG